MADSERAAEVRIIRRIQVAAVVSVPLALTILVYPAPVVVAVLVMMFAIVGAADWATISLLRLPDDEFDKYVRFRRKTTRPFSK